MDEPVTSLIMEYNVDSFGYKMINMKKDREDGRYLRA